MASIQHSSDSNRPLVIDNGSHECRVGWSGEQQPQLLFSNLIAKPRPKKGEIDNVTLVGSEIQNINLIRPCVRTQFERDVVVNFDLQENVFDYIFTQMNFTEDHIDSPLVLTETLCNPLTSRSNMNELLFECYGIPSLALGVDSLFSHYFNYRHSALPYMDISSDCIIVKAGANVTQIIPIINHNPAFEYAKRINVGGLQAVNYLYKLLHLTYPHHASIITLSRAQSMYEELSFHAVDYIEELEKWNNLDKPPQSPPYGQIHYQLSAGESIDPSKQEEMERIRRSKIARKIQNQKLKMIDSKLTPLYSRSSKLKMTSETEEESNAFRFLLERENLASFDDLLLALGEVERKIEELRKQRTEIQERRSENILDGKSEAFEKERNDLKLRKQLLQDNSNNTNKQELQCRSKELEELEAILLLYEEMADEATNPKSLFEIPIGIERFRIPEVIHQPSMIGIDQSGVVGTIDYVLKQLPPEVTRRVEKNIFITGANSLIHRFKDRLERDIMSILPFECKYTVYVAHDARLDAWRGASMWSSSNESENCFLKKSVYEEYGPYYFVQHKLSNQYTKISEQT